MFCISMHELRNNHDSEIITLNSFFAQTLFKLLRILKCLIFDMFQLFSTFRVRDPCKSRENIGNLLKNQLNLISINTCWFHEPRKNP